MAPLTRQQEEPRWRSEHQWTAVNMGEASLTLLLLISHLQPGSWPATNWHWSMAQGLEPWWASLNNEMPKGHVQGWSLPFPKSIQWPLPGWPWQKEAWLQGLLKSFSKIQPSQVHLWLGCFLIHFESKHVHTHTHTTEKDIQGNETIPFPFLSRHKITRINSSPQNSDVFTGPPWTPLQLLGWSESTLEKVWPFLWLSPPVSQSVNIIVLPRLKGKC